MKKHLLIILALSLWGLAAQAQTYPSQFPNDPWYGVYQPHYPKPVFCVTDAWGNVVCQ